MAWGFNSNNNLRYHSNNQRQTPFLPNGQNPHLRGFAQSQTRQQRQQNRAFQLQNLQQQQFHQQHSQQPPLFQQPQQQSQQPPPFQQQQPFQQQSFQQQPQQQQNRQTNQRQQRQQPFQQPQPQQPQQPAKDPSVSYEPLTEDVLKLLGAGKGNPTDAQTPVEAPSIANMPEAANIPDAANKTPDTERALRMGQILQNERNSSVFYDHLSALGESRSNSQLKDLFAQISDRSKKRADSFRDMFRKYNNMEFTTVDKPIYKANNLAEGVKFAIREESGAINEIADMFDYDLEDKFTKELNAILYRKISDLGRLLSI